MSAAHDTVTEGEAALLVDADNVSAQGVEQAVVRLAQRGLRLTVRRAYGGHEKLAGMRECLLRHGVRAFVNQGKGTTDALLVVDAMDLLHRASLPPVVAIASSDADFAPLALRLREEGTWVICFAHAAKSADVDLSRCYDELVYVDPGSAQSSEAAPASAPEPAREPARKTAARKRAAAPAPASAAADPVRQLLESIEGFRQGRSLELNDVVKKLRDAKLLGRNASGPNFLKKSAGYVELIPASQPNKVRLKAHPG
jgi:hypothetical protein